MTAKSPSDRVPLEPINAAVKLSWIFAALPSERITLVGEKVPVNIAEETSPAAKRLPVEKSPKASVGINAKFSDAPLERSTLKLRLENVRKVATGLPPPACVPLKTSSP